MIGSDIPRGWNSSRPLHLVWVRVGMALVLNWRSGWSIHPIWQYRYSSREISQPVWVWRVVSGLRRGSICRLMYCSWFCCLIIVFYKNHVLNIQFSVFACFAVCDINYFGICVFPFLFCIFAYNEGKQFHYELKYPHDPLITEYARWQIVDAPLTLTFVIGYQIYVALCCQKRPPLPRIWILAP